MEVGDWRWVVVRDAVGCGGGIEGKCPCGGWRLEAGGGVRLSVSVEVRCYSLTDVQ